jgi:hypothetical protein
MNQPKPMIPDKVANRVPPAIPVKITKSIERIAGSQSFWGSVKEWLANRALKLIIKNAVKIIKLVNKYEDYLLVYIKNPTIRTLIDGATDVLEKLIEEWTKEKK